ncbi:hypothetical protein HJC23_004641 [Cyclotella cryptica]|uniref:Uncharacterized protein n=1 Tax=Cyclotella cryptica TaxID=29204 RepID=A0ABD3QG66_9STRA|eukprot:CCRYP_005965-RA/>CCRYP_005965-RA protein AED:0.28 eAED:0.28 QI:0/-1/0/1/-1/1/1/0/180
MSPASPVAQAQGLALLEEWPRHNSLTEHNEITAPSNPKKQVTFSAYSSARFYKCDSTYRSNMSYTSADCKMFRAAVAQEGLRIQRLVSSCPPTKTGNVIHHLVELNALAMEELIGIEHLVSKDAPIRLLHERRAHSSIVLKAQKETQRREDLCVDVVARVAVASSSRNIRKARLRAALAA